jgi:triacylglycerol esterase/lipase EstA (alpha/beta hydrolase family)
MIQIQCIRPLMIGVYRILTWKREVALIQTIDSNNTADRYFTKLKVSVSLLLPLIKQTLIETSRSISGKKVVLIGHSMGSQVIFWFMKWYLRMTVKHSLGTGWRLKDMVMEGTPGAMITLPRLSM